MPSLNLFSHFGNIVCNGKRSSSILYCFLLSMLMAQGEVGVKLFFDTSQYLPT